MPVPKTKAYNPAPAFQWSIQQLRTVSEGGTPDKRVRTDVADDLVKLATKESADGYKAFWINGYAEAVRFDETFLANAARIAKERAIMEAPTKWHAGTAHGTIVGELKKVDDLEGNQEFVIVPRTGPDFIRCTFSPDLRDEMGKYLFKTVRVRGMLHYQTTSPFPWRVDAQKIEEYPLRKGRKTLAEMRGIFAEFEKPKPDWDSILNA